MNDTQRSHTSAAPSPNSSVRIGIDTLELQPEILDFGDIPAADTAAYALWLGDDALVLGQRSAWWISRGPELEEDLAMSNITLDLIGHARSFLHYAGTGLGQAEDDLAYFRDEEAFRSLHLMEQPNRDYADAMVQLLFASAYFTELYVALRGSADRTLAAIAEKAIKEIEYHWDHAVQWVVRFGQGTAESRHRLVRALGDLSPYLEEAFTEHPLTDRLTGIAPRPGSLRAGFDRRVNAALDAAGVTAESGFVASGGGRNGVHSEHLGPMLAEMQVLARKHPGVTW